MRKILSAVSLIVFLLLIAGCVKQKETTMQADEINNIGLDKEANNTPSDNTIDNSDD